jgi:hypothetical protein
MASIGNEILDGGLDHLDTEADVLHICSQEPTSYAEASSTYTLGNKAGPTVAAPSERGGGGRECVISAINDGSVTGTDTATHWALVDVSGTALLATEELASPQSVTSGNTFTLTEFAVGIPDPA